MTASTVRKCPVRSADHCRDEHCAHRRDRRWVIRVRPNSWFRRMTQTRYRKNAYMRIFSRWKEPSTETVVVDGPAIPSADDRTALSIAAPLSADNDRTLLRVTERSAVDGDRAEPLALDQAHPGDDRAPFLAAAPQSEPLKERAAFLVVRHTVGTDTPPLSSHNDGGGDDRTAFLAHDQPEESGERTAFLAAEYPGTAGAVPESFTDDECGRAEGRKTFLPPGLEESGLELPPGSQALCVNRAAAADDKTTFLDTVQAGSDDNRTTFLARDPAHRASEGTTSLGSDRSSAADDKTTFRVPEPASSANQQTTSSSGDRASVADDKTTFLAPGPAGNANEHTKSSGSDRTSDADEKTTFLIPGPTGSVSARTASPGADRTSITDEKTTFLDPVQSCSTGERLTFLGPGSAEKPAERVETSDRRRLSLADEGTTFLDAVHADSTDEHTTFLGPALAGITSEQASPSELDDAISNDQTAFWATVQPGGANERTMFLTPDRPAEAREPSKSVPAGEPSEVQNPTILLAPNRRNQAAVQSASADLPRITSDAAKPSPTREASATEDRTSYLVNDRSDESFERTTFLTPEPDDAADPRTASSSAQAARDDQAETADDRTTFSIAGAIGAAAEPDSTSIPDQVLAADERTTFLAAEQYIVADDRTAWVGVAPTAAPHDHTVLLAVDETPTADKAPRGSGTSGATPADERTTLLIRDAATVGDDRTAFVARDEADAADGKTTVLVADTAAPTADPTVLLVAGRPGPADDRTTLLVAGQAAIGEDQTLLLAPDHGTFADGGPVPADDRTTLLAADAAPNPGEPLTLLNEDRTSLLAADRTALLKNDGTALLVGDQPTAAGDRISLLADDQATLLINDQTALLTDDQSTLVADQPARVSRPSKVARMSDQSSTQISATDPPITIDGRFVLEQRLGGGGMGVVYRARDRLMEKRRDRDPFVALKLISESLRDNEEARNLLQRECSRAQKLSHPNIVRVFYYGCDNKTDSDYLTMELLRGEPLERVIRANPAGLKWSQASLAIEQLCSGLAFAHAEGIVHSDIKPSNLFMTDAQILKILDFGIAAPLRNADTASSETLFNPRQMGAVAPRYSSLEMFLGKDADPSDDVYSAACVIYELLTGKHPYQGLETPRAAELNLVPAAVSGLSRAQNKALRKALHFRRRDRTATMTELKEALLRPARSFPLGLPVFGVAAGVAALAAVSAFIVLQPNSNWRSHLPFTGGSSSPAGEPRAESSGIEASAVKITPPMQQPAPTTPPITDVLNLSRPAPTRQVTPGPPPAAVTVSPSVTDKPTTPKSSPVTTFEDPAKSVQQIPTKPQPVTDAVQTAQPGRQDAPRTPPLAASADQVQSSQRAAAQVQPVTDAVRSAQTERPAPAKAPPSAGSADPSKPAQQTALQTPVTNLATPAPEDTKGTPMPAPMSTSAPQKRSNSVKRPAQKAPPMNSPATNSALAQKKKLSDGRCASIVERTQLGETLSDEEKAYYKQTCE
jgi:serine/threonine protein kinase